MTVTQASASKTQRSCVPSVPANLESTICCDVFFSLIVLRWFCKSVRSSAACAACILHVFSSIKAALFYVDTGSVSNTITSEELRIRTNILDRFHTQHRTHLRVSTSDSSSAVRMCEPSDIVGPDVATRSACLASFLSCLSFDCSSCFFCCCQAWVRVPTSRKSTPTPAIVHPPQSPTIQVEGVLVAHDASWQTERTTFCHVAFGAL